MAIGRLIRVPIREVWRHEAFDFTRWLQENLDVLNEALGRGFSGAEREQSVGTFNVDLVAEDESGDPVIIENQYDKTDHDHLGKIITYLTNLEAKTAVWIVEKARPEHIKAIGWLNGSSSAEFYLVQLEVVSIGGSDPAPLLTLIVGPSEETREVGRKRQELASQQIDRLRFWEGLLERARDRTNLHANISPTKGTWIAASSGLSGVTFNYVTRQHDVQVELYIDRGRERDVENEAIFDALFAAKEEIEAEFGEPLDWQRLGNARACRIRKTSMIGGYRDEDRYGELQEWMVDAMCRLERALQRKVDELPR